MRIQRPLLALLALSLLLGGCGTATKAPAANGPKIAAYVDQGVNLGGRPAPGFTLVDQSGKTVSLSQFKGKVVVLAFVDSACTTVCPLTTESMKLALDLLGPAAGRVQLLGVNANPQHLSLEDVAAYTTAHGLTRNWLFLTGTVAQVRAVWRNYGIYVKIVKGALDHTPALYVIDAKGRENRLFMTSMRYAGVGQEAYVLAKTVAKLLPGHVTVRPLGAPKILSTRKPLSVPAPSGGQVRLSPSSAHLTLFFASWAPDVQAELAALSAYGKGAFGLPPLTAIDVEDTEPSAAALQGVLSGDAGKITYPVGIDKTGAVADAYGAQDIPWFTLTGAGGRILWTHDGWLGVPELESAVQAQLARAQTK
ncbi:MAG: SCO family protein [Thermaerobacter sp.]|nr:SCO family protein [Thermaerobacter sp.]